MPGLQKKQKPGTADAATASAVPALTASRAPRSGPRSTNDLKRQLADCSAQLAQRDAELAVIASIQRGIRAELNFQAIIDLVGNELRKVFGTDEVCIRWWDEQANLIHYLHEFEHGERLHLPPETPRQGGVFETIVRTRQRSVLRNLAEMTAAGIRLIEGTQQSLSIVQVPIIGIDRVLGVLLIENYEREDAFSDADVRLLETIASSMSVALENARLFDETQRLLEETTRRSSELALINDIQRGMAAKLDFQAIVDVVGDRLRALFASNDLGINWVDATTGLVHQLYVVERGQRLHIPPIVIDPQGKFAAALGSGQPLVLRDRAATESYGIRTAPGTVPSRSSVFVPVTANGQTLGTIRLVSLERDDAFDDATISLLVTVAAAMAVALENARLFTETKGALARQTASAEVLQVISGSMADAQPVFEGILNSCARLFATPDLGIFLVDDTAQLHATAVRGNFNTWAPTSYPRPVAGSITQMSVERGSTVYWADTLADAQVPAYLKAIAQTHGNFAGTVTPLMWQGRGIGSLNVMRNPPRPFSDADLAMLRTFADQAVIAIQNARLFNETEAALQRQTASADILRVISQSPNDVMPVVDVIVSTARRLLGCHRTVFLRRENEVLVAMRGATANGVTPG